MTLDTVASATTITAMGIECRRGLDNLFIGYAGDRVVSVKFFPSYVCVGWHDGTRACIAVGLGATLERAQSELIDRLAEFADDAR